jgi:hypothetical protein
MRAVLFLALISLALVVLGAWGMVDIAAIAYGDPLHPDIDPDINPA